MTFMPLDQKDLDVGLHTGEDNLFLVSPQVICHEINKQSPLWQHSKNDLENDPFEIILILEGTIESTGAICQARTSYLNSEIMWGKV